MPTARSPSTCWTASVTIPAGFVKLISHAFGACCAIVSASRTITGIVRSAKQMPPGPVVSWPSTPSPSGTSSSIDAALELADADRGEDEVGALDGVHEVGRGPERQPRPVLGGQPVEHRADPFQPGRRRCRAARPRRGSAARPSRAAPRTRAGRGSRRRRRSSISRERHLDPGRVDGRAAGGGQRRVGDDRGRSTPARTRARRRSSRTSPRRRSARRGRRRRSSAA